MRLLEIPLKNGDYAVVRPCPRADLPVLEWLLSKLHEQWRSGKALTSETCEQTLDKLLLHLPREDDLASLTADQISEVDLGRLFLAKMDDQGHQLPCDLLTLHQYEPCKPSKTSPKLEDEMTEDNIPIPSSGDPTADLLAVLTQLCQGNALAAQHLLDTHDAETLDKLVFSYNERQRDPQERLADYRAKVFEEKKTQMTEQIRRVQFGF